ncbi:kinetochore Sim4 complex subunit Fta4 [Exophiala viscosa]|uniref:Kinetochore Sim4 complex subunit Fta4 n=1 Tax=Exophiala viscosa TaxID=2486360 RepID=A0AAN6DRH7_9EURO|nr:kinetochore Sim4 complex subunit Fta4 [Exophiala viscosa]KAI1623788.1 kinetochore Sim4 complex subunit Fta4 [Exophiala viscosa]
MEEQSITAIKAAFIRSQVRHLSTPLELSTQWRDLAADPDQDKFSDKSIQTVIAKVNEKIKQHNRMVFSQQSQRLVAEQIESLHWTLVDAENKHAETNIVIVKRDADLTDASDIDALPEAYEDLYLNPDHDQDRATDVEASHAETYTTLREKLSELARERDAMRQRLSRHKYLQKLLEPLDNPQASVQPNLVARDGEMSKELDRMRVLLARVTAKVSDMDKTKQHNIRQPG